MARVGWHSDCGTALIVADISFDLEAQLPGRRLDADEPLVRQAKARLFQHCRTSLTFRRPTESSSDGTPSFGTLSRRGRARSRTHRVG